MKRFALRAGYVVVMALAILSLIGNRIPGTRAYAIRQAQMRVAHDLIDPDSAKFRDIGVFSINHEQRVCGEVNGRSRQGGYAGYVRFVYLVKSKTVLIQPTDELGQPDDGFPECAAWPNDPAR